MRMSKATALAVLALSLFCLTCQRSGQPAGENAGGNSNNSTANAQANSASQQPSAPQTQLKVGDRAPDFELTDTEGQKVRLSDFRGKKNVVLAFYVLAFTGG
jgi:cytochrome oxidase Cu insertion factor (SCO1/SenC/PrrC family)